MRSGMAPLDAGLQTLRDVVRHGALRNRDEQGRVQFDLRLFLLAKDGRHAGVSIWGGKQMTVVDEQGARHEDCTPLYEGERPQ
jgi:N4-(beta-N-acetylglucosaminyl)-L-asparaginase